MSAVGECIYSYTSIDATLSFSFLSLSQLGKLLKEIVCISGEQTLSCRCRLHLRKASSGRMMGTSVARALYNRIKLFRVSEIPTFFMQTGTSLGRL